MPTCAMLNPTVSAVRVVYPKLQGGFVFGGGAICFEPLTPKGWASAMSLPALAIAIKGFFDCSSGVALRLVLVYILPGNGLQPPDRLWVRK